MYTVSLSEVNCLQLQHTALAGTIPACTTTGGCILLHADEGEDAPGKSDWGIVTRLAVGVRTVERLR